MGGGIAGSAAAAWKDGMLLRLRLPPGAGWGRIGVDNPDAMKRFKIGWRTWGQPVWLGRTWVVAQVALWVGAGVTVGAEAPAKQAGDRFEGLLATGHHQFGAQDYAAARAAYGEIAAATNGLAAHRAIARLRLAQTYLRERNWAAARVELAKVGNLTEAPVHLVLEASELARESERLERGLPARDPRASRTVLPVAAAPGMTVHVAPMGSDSDSGTAGRPLATLEGARDRVRALKAERGLPLGGIMVLVHGGRYSVRQTFRLGAEDSGGEEAPIIYRAAAGETPVFSGGVRLTGFAEVEDPAVLARLLEEARGQVREVDLKAHGVTNLWPLELGGFASGRGFVTHPVMELFVAGQPQPLARWPNDGFVRVAEVTGAPPNPEVAAAASAEVRIRYEGDRPARWGEERELLLYGYWYYDWADSYERVKRVEVEQREFVLAPPYHRYGYRKGQRLYALNALSEIDRPGEWCIDRGRGKLYWHAPAAVRDAEVELSVAPFPFLELEEVSHVRFEGLTWELGCGDGVVVRGGEGCVWAGCTVRRFGGNGIDLRGGRGHGVQACDLYSLGRGGLRVAGGDRRTLEAGQHWVENCHLYDLSRVDHTYTPAVWLDGVGNRVAHNLMHHLGSSAMRVEGNEHQIEYNEITHVVLESDDQGGVDMFGNPTYRGNVYRYNYFHHIGHWRQPTEEPACGQAGIRLDDSISGTLVYGNVFYRCATGKLGFGGVQIHGGKENIVDNNLFVDCVSAVSFSPWGERRWREFTQDALAAPGIDHGLYLERYPALAGLSEGHDQNWLWRNLAVRCGRFLHRNRGGALLFDNAVTDDDPGFVDFGAGEFALRGEVPMLDLLSFRPIPFGELGLYRDAHRRELPGELIRALRRGLGDSSR